MPVWRSTACFENWLLRLPPALHPTRTQTSDVAHKPARTVPAGASRSPASVGASSMVACPPDPRRRKGVSGLPRRSGDGGLNIETWLKRAVFIPIRTGTRAQDRVLLIRALICPVRAQARAREMGSYETGALFRTVRAQACVRAGWAITSRYDVSARYG